MAFSAVDILAEFVEAGGCTVAAQRWLDFDGCRVVGADRRRWNTPEERERSRKRYARTQRARHAARARWAKGRP